MRYISIPIFYTFYTFYTFFHFKRRFLYVKMCSYTNNSVIELSSSLSALYSICRIQHIIVPTSITLNIMITSFSDNIICITTYTDDFLFHYKHVVSNILALTKYGSILELGRLSSKYPHPSLIVLLPIRIEAPLLAFPYVNIL